MSVLRGGISLSTVIEDELPEGQFFECYHCWYKTRIKLSLEDHMRTHLVEKPYACDLCDFKASQKNYLMQHKKAHVLFGCSICDYKSYDKTRVKDHLEKAHRTPTTKKLLRCRSCGYETPDEAYMAKHMAARHVEDNYMCRICDYKTHRKRLLLTHMVKEHPGMKPFTCDECDYKASSVKNLHKHMKRHSAEKPFSCDTCEFRAASKHSLEAHKKIHGERSFACTVCDYTSYNKSNVNDHMKIHTGVKPLACTFCPYSTRKNSDLKRHMKVHSMKKKPYKCKVCNHRTNEKYTLEKHMKTHTGEHPFGCSICAKSYIRKSGLSDHIVKVHAIREGASLKCQSCDYMAKKASDMTNHILNSHTRSGPAVLTAEEAEYSFVLEERVQLFSPSEPSEHDLTAHSVPGTADIADAFSGTTNVTVAMPGITELTHVPSSEDITHAIPSTNESIIFVATENTDGTIVVTAQPSVLTNFFTAEGTDEFDATDV